MPSRYPFTSTASVAMTYNATSKSDSPVTIDTLRMTNPTRFVIEIRELRFLLHTNFDPTPGVTPSDAAPFVFVEAKVGKDYLTDGLVPLSIMAPFRVRFDTFNENSNDDIWRSAGVNGVPDNTVSTRRIIFRKPIYLRPGVGFRINAAIPTSPLLLGIVSKSFTATLFATIVGRYMLPEDPVPRVHEVPMISSTLLRQTKLISLEQEFGNPLTKNLPLFYLIGTRCTAAANRLTLDAEHTSPATGLELTLPNGEKISELPLNFRSYFGQGHVFPFPYSLEASERIRARITANALEADGATRTAYLISLVGSRSEAVS